LQKERIAKEKEAAHQAVLARNQRMLEADEDESDSDSDSDDESEVREALGGDMMSITPDDDIQELGTNDRGKRKREKGIDVSDWNLDGDEGLTKQLLSYDIYLKGNVSKGTSFFKNVGGQAQRFRMFPYVEKKRKVDEYGETIDVGMWLRKGKVLEEEAENEEARELKRSRQTEDADKVFRSETLHSELH
jgi:cleavage and polyadenylation specificity factor subunit 2